MNGMRTSHEMFTGIHASRPGEFGAIMIPFILSFVSVVVLGGALIESSTVLYARSKLFNGAEAALLAAANLYDPSGNQDALNSKMKNEYCSGNSLISDSTSLDFGEIDDGILLLNTSKLANLMFIPGNMNLNITVAAEVSMPVATLEGIVPIAVHCSSGGAGGYALFNKGADQKLEVNGTSIAISGSGRSEGDIVVNGSSISVTGGLTYTSGATVDLGGNDITTSEDDAQSNPTLPISLDELSEIAAADGTSFSGDVKLTMATGGKIDVTHSGGTTKVKADAVIYTDGKIEINEESFNRQVTLVSTAGDVMINAKDATLTPASAAENLLIYSAGITTINGEDASITGIVDAGGKLTFNGNSGTSFDGQLWGDYLVLNGDNFTLTGPSGSGEGAGACDGFSFGEEYTIKDGGGDGAYGNYGPLALGGTGSSVYESVFKNGYGGEVSLGDFLNTEPGNMKGPTEDAVTARIASGDDIILIVLTDDYPKGRDQIEVIGFAAFQLTGVDNKGAVTGTFVDNYKVSGKGSMTAPDYGVKTRPRLVFH